MALPDVYVPEPFLGVKERLEHVRFLDVHVVGVQVDRHLCTVHLVQELKGVPAGVEQIGFVAIDHLQRQADVERLRLIGQVS